MASDEEEEEEEFGYVNRASVRDVLARVKAREAMGGENGRARSLFDGSQRIRNGDGPSERYFDVDVPRRSKNALFFGSSVQSGTTPTTPDAEVFATSQQPVQLPSGKTPTRERSSPVSDRTELSISPIVAAIDLAPQPTGQDLTITRATTHLSCSIITTTISQPPNPPHECTSLIFSQATAIIYCCMAVAASHQALLGLGGDIAAMGLIMRLYGAFHLGIVICIVLQLLLGAGLRRVPVYVLRR